MIIKNYDELSSTVSRRNALQILEAGLLAVLPKNVMRSAIQYDISSMKLTINHEPYDLSSGRIFVIGGGKAAGAMAETLESIIPPETITAGVVNCNSDNNRTAKIKIITASHPLPDQRGIEGVKMMMALKDEYIINENDTIICLLSGGGSALMPYPVDDVTLEDQQKLTELLLTSGAAIQDMNAVRKHLSKVKGGGLGNYLSPARVISLIISDVVGNDIGSIASGPTYPNISTFKDAFDVLKKYDLLSRSPENIINYIKKNVGTTVKETPGSTANCINHIIADNGVALAGMAEETKALDLNPKIVTTTLTGAPEEAANKIAGEILAGKHKGYDVLLFGGETTPTLSEQVRTSTGGRNQHFAACYMQTLKNYPGIWTLASFATDGIDFIEGVAGALVDNTSLSSAEENGLDVVEFIKNYDSNTFFERLGNALIRTDETGTNVGDVMIYILEH